MQQFRNSEVPLDNDQHLINQFSVCVVKTTSALLLFGSKIKMEPYKNYYIGELVAHKMFSSLTKLYNLCFLFDYLTLVRKQWVYSVFFLLVQIQYLVDENTAFSFTKSLCTSIGYKGHTWDKWSCHQCVTGTWGCQPKDGLEVTFKNFQNR